MGTQFAAEVGNKAIANTSSIIFELDYEGNMSYYQNQLARKGISKEMLDMDNFVGLTARELQSIVDSVQLKRKE